MSLQTSARWLTPRMSNSRLVAMLATEYARRRAAPSIFARRRLPPQKLEQDGDLSVAETEVGHRHVAVSRAEGGGDRIVLGQHLVGRLQVAHEPAVLTACSDAQKVGPDRIAFADGVAGAASALEDECARLGRREAGDLGIAPGRLSV